MPDINTVHPGTKEKDKSRKPFKRRRYSEYFNRNGRSVYLIPSFEISPGSYDWYRRCRRNWVNSRLIEIIW